MFGGMIVLQTLTTTLIIIIIHKFVITTVLPLQHKYAIFILNPVPLSYLKLKNQNERNK